MQKIKNNFQINCCVYPQARACILDTWPQPLPQRAPVPMFLHTPLCKRLLLLPSLASPTPTRTWFCIPHVSACVTRQHNNQGALLCSRQSAAEQCITATFLRVLQTRCPAIARTSDPRNATCQCRAHVSNTPTYVLLKHSENQTKGIAATP